MNVLVIDNGAHSLKIGLSSGDASRPRIVQNTAMRSKVDKRLYIGHEIEECTDFSSVTYRMAFERGFLTDWDVEKAVWDGLFSQDVLSITPSDVSLLITEPYFNLPNIQETYDQMIFEEYEFDSYYRCTSASVAARGDVFRCGQEPRPECMVVVDSGYSFTHIVPILNGSVVWGSVRRIDVGGKLLTNHLKELVSFRQWNMMDQTWIMSDVKERCCYVSSAFHADLEACKTNPRRNAIVQEYVLPDFSSKRNGYLRGPDDIVGDDDQVLLMENERFSVPEVLFTPSDIGIRQAGLAEMISQSIASLPAELRGLFWANIGLIGGSTAFPGFDQRMTELRSLAPSEYKVGIYRGNDPVTHAYESALVLARSPTFKHLVVTRAEYEENGSNAVRRRFRTHGDAPPDRSLTQEQIVDSLQLVSGTQKKATTLRRKTSMGPPPVPHPIHGRALRARKSESA